MAMTGPRSKRFVSEINVTPLVDVVLVLLIAFMVLTPLAEKQMFIRIPEETAQILPADQALPDQTVLTLKTDGRVLLNRQEMTFGEAMAQVRGGYQGRRSRVLFFNAEDDVRYDDAVRVLDAARQAGVATIGMMTDLPAPAGR